MEGEYEVVNIYRNYEAQLSFTLVLHAAGLEEMRVDKSLTTAVSQGLLFIGDTIRITAKTADGIVFDVLPRADAADRTDDGAYSESRAKEEDSLLYAEKGARKHRYLPFLCDVLPYHAAGAETAEASPVYKDGVFQGRYLIEGAEVTNIKAPLPPQFVAKIHQKTRINMYPNSYNPFFFIIVASNNVLLKIVFWRESLRRYSSLQVGDIIFVKEYKPKKKLPFIERMEYNTFTESVYFDCEEITARSILRVNASKKGSVQRLFETVEGTVTYLSVLMRVSCNTSMMEYVLCRVDNRSVVLFYNSDDAFSQIRDGCSIRITELRPVTRAGFECYMSTIYTQFTVLDQQTAEIRGSIEEGHLVPFDINDSSRNASGAGAMKENGADTQEPVIAKRPLSPERSANKRRCVNSVFGAIGFLPDDFGSTAEILESSSTEIIHGRTVSVNLSMKPHITTIEDLQGQTLVLNETKKFIVRSMLAAAEIDGISIDYLENGEPKQQHGAKLTLERGFTCYCFENFFAPALARPAHDFDLLVGKQLYFVLECIRADIDTVLYYVTGIMKS
ncbi:hypothetical protein PAPHI01_0235 [Pancytospora philotis]|nr:hypothetical protein PAPHI01_0235 [Pancytospora philotis]